MIAETLNISKVSVYSIMVEDLRKRKLCAPFVQHLLIAEEKEQRMVTCQDFVDYVDRLFIFEKNYYRGWIMVPQVQPHEEAAERRMSEPERKMTIESFCDTAQKEDNIAHILCSSTAVALFLKNSFSRGPQWRPYSTGMPYSNYWSAFVAYGLKNNDWCRYTTLP